MWLCVVVPHTYKGEAGHWIVAGSEESANMDHQMQFIRIILYVTIPVYIIIAECSKMRQVLIVATSI